MWFWVSTSCVINYSENLLLSEHIIAYKINSVAILQDNLLNTMYVGIWILDYIYMTACVVCTPDRGLNSDKCESHRYEYVELYLTPHEQSFPYINKTIVSRCKR